MIRIVLVISICLAFFSCADSRPKDILPPDKMQEVLWDYFSADAFTTEFISRDSAKNLSAENVKLQKAIFGKYKITRETFYKSYEYYQHHPKEMTVMLDSIMSIKNRVPEPQKKPSRDSIRAVQ